VALITFEGGDGAGKSTMLRWLADELRHTGRTVCTVQEPGGTPLGDEIRQLLLHTGMQPLTELFLLEAARSQVVADVIAPALQRGEIVLCDRYIDSTVAYQGYGRGLDLTLIGFLNRLATGHVWPDLTLLLDVDPAIGLVRRQQAGAVNRFDRERLEFAACVRAGYQAQAAHAPKRIVVLDATQDLAVLQKALWQAVEAIL
jgi:dTMP kinase